MNDSNKLYSYFTDDQRDGIISLHPFNLEEIGWTDFTNSIKSDPNTTFRYTGSHSSRLFGGYYHRYQQLYKGIEVEDGGFTIRTNTDDIEAIPGPCDNCPPPTELCDEVYSFAPFIYEDIDISVNPVVTDQQIKEILQPGSSNNNNNNNNYNSESGDSAPLFTKELRIVNNLGGECEYRLAYIVKYRDSLSVDMAAWVDAHTGQLLYQTHQHYSKNAPTADHGIQFMNDNTDIYGLTELVNHRLRCLDFTGLQVYDYNNFSYTPKSPSTRDWNASDANPEVFQLFWMTDQVLEVIADKLGITFFHGVRVGYHPNFKNAKAEPRGPNYPADIIFGKIEGRSTVEFDVIAHELGHHIIFEFIRANLIGSNTLHEGIADMIGVYIESLLQPNGIDWVMGDDMPYSAGRDLENTSRNCFTEIKYLDDQHDRSEALGHWFYLCVNGDVNKHILPLPIDEVLTLVLEALPNLGSNPDYPDLMRATVALAKEKYGPCSEALKTILRAWDAICVPTNSRLVHPLEPCDQLEGPAYVCEENNNIRVCAISYTGVDYNYAEWTIIGRNSTSFVSTGTMVGNSQYGGDCLKITTIPDMPYYPQTITIQFRAPKTDGTGDLTLTKRIKILDCDHDDLTCQEYYAQFSKPVDNTYMIQQEDAYTAENLEAEMRQQVESGELKVIIYDIMGNIVNPNTPYWSNGSPQIWIYTYWDKSGRFVKSQKVYKIN